MAEFSNLMSHLKFSESLVNFPSEIDSKKHIRIYDESSLNNQMAVLSHVIHNPKDLIEPNGKQLYLESISKYFEMRDNYSESPTRTSIPEDILEMMICEPVACPMFSDFFNVPFPNPRKAKFTFIDLFAGIGGIRLPFTELGYKCVFSSEWDKNAQKTYFANFGEIPFGDICKDTVKDYIPNDFDLLLAGFPCQAFSIMGKQRGFEDARGTLFFEVASILDKHRPKAFILENVKQLTTHDKGRTFATILSILKDLGYSYKWSVLNALDFGIPQKRERVIIVGFLQPELTDMFNFDFKKIPYNLDDILEDDKDVDTSLFASDNIIQKRIEKTRNKQIFYPSVWHENKSGNISILDYACALRTGASYNYLLVNGRRRPSSRELLRFQGFPDNFTIAVSHSEIRKQTGNSVPVPMIRAIAHKINNILAQFY